MRTGPTYWHTTSSRRLALALVLCCAIPGVVCGQARGQTGSDEKPAQAIEEALAPLLESARRRWEAPGLAVAIVHRDQVLLRTLGVRAIGQPEPVTPDTIFPLASCTKPVTTLAMAMLVDDGVLAWDDPVRRHWPDFHLHDRNADELVTLRDLVTHRTGVGGHDILWYYGPWGLEERVRRFARLEPSAAFRADFQYQTIAFDAAGLAAARAARRSWEELAAERVFKPLGMKHTFATYPKDAGMRELAEPHRRDREGKVRKISRFPLGDADPAGSVHSTARDLGEFLRLQLSDGKHGGRRLLRAETLATLHEPQIVIKAGEYGRKLNPMTQLLCYAHGWIVQDYRGRKILMHGGAIDGFRAHLTLMPEEKLGIALLSNLDGGLMNFGLSNQILDLYLQAPERDWCGYYLALAQAELEEKRATQQAIRTHRATVPAKPLAAYAGRYHDEAYGEARVEVRDGRLLWQWGRGRWQLEHFEGDDFYVDQQEPPLFLSLSFQVDREGRVQSARMQDRSFRKLAE